MEGREGAFWAIISLIRARTSVRQASKAMIHEVKSPSFSHIL